MTPTTLPVGWWAPCVSFFVALAVLSGLLKSGAAKIALDRPNERSLHVGSVPRTGGLALMAGVFAGWLALFESRVLGLLGCAVLLMAISFLDDLVGLRASWRFLAHLLVACAAVLLGGLEPGWVVPAILVCVWMTNLYNFMDGSDGLAGGMALFGFGSYALGFWLGGDLPLALVCLSVSGAAAAFLVFNFHPAKIFMGDVGSIPLGFLAAMLGMRGWQAGRWPIWFPALVFAPFIVDATVTILRRLARRVKIWEAHREHYYQRYILLGAGHRKTALCEYALMASCGLSAVWAISLPAMLQVSLLAVWAVGFGGLMRWVDHSWAQFKRS